MKPILTYTILLLLQQYIVAQKFDVYQRPLQSERSRDYDAIHYRITLNVDLEKKMLAGENRITLSPLNDNFEKCTLDASYLSVEKVINGDGTNLPFEQSNDQVFISLGRNYNNADTIELSVEYSLTITYHWKQELPHTTYLINQFSSSLSG